MNRLLTDTSPLSHPQGNDIYVNSGTLTCTAGCNDAGMYMPSGSCTSPVAADVYGGTCVSYCASSASDCAVCEDNTFYEGYSTNTACDSCDSGKYIVSDEASDHASADQCSSCSSGYYLKGTDCEICGELRRLCSGAAAPLSSHAFPTILTNACSS